MISVYIRRCKACGKLDDTTIQVRHECIYCNASDWEPYDPDSTDRPCLECAALRTAIDAITIENERLRAELAQREKDNRLAPTSDPPPGEGTA